MTTRLIFAAGALVLATTCLASAQDFTGVVSIDGAFEQTESRSDDIGGAWATTSISSSIAAIAGKAGVVVAPDVSLQFDAWTKQLGGSLSGYSSVHGPSSFRYTLQTYGSAVHLTYHHDGFLIGVAGSIGVVTQMGDVSDSAGFGAVAIDVGYEADDFSILGQLGTGVGLSRWAAMRGNYESSFATLRATYYLEPDLSVGVHGSFATIGLPFDGTKTVAGTEIRYKLPDTPLILSAAYTYFRYDQQYDSYATSEVHHLATAGLRIPFGARSGTLRDLDRATGLSMSPPSYANERPL